MSGGMNCSGSLMQLVIQSRRMTFITAIQKYWDDQNTRWRKYGFITLLYLFTPHLNFFDSRLCGSNFSLWRPLIFACSVSECRSGCAFALWWSWSSSGTSGYTIRRWKRRKRWTGRYKVSWTLRSTVSDSAGSVWFPSIFPNVQDRRNW